ncbi:dethiobiotin synthase [Mycobacterium sp. 852013-51886_SCH5428379]|uniref:dethiobiotin synthase n=1 Tax=Mycobacterium sp. 852013-51886_SCH5428379 TaxID=1834111 RepID=UPI0007FEE5DF|nr:dethiobiotin synthase [Mycobacterium sp. 852013-51886_SCH5428379]OBB59682.1 dethiobiotin synthase [Mycobacterium sp. 852013-51886_SCH5428379]
MSVLIVTGTDTGVGKTVATAALACAARLAEIDVAVCKPVQTGIDPVYGPGDDDLVEIARLSGVRELYPGWRYPEPLAPVAAATRADAALPTRADLVELVRTADGPGRLVLVEGAGGLLVELGRDGVTLRDLAVALAAPVLLVVAPGLGTLNHTALTLEALVAQGVSCAGLIIGAWPAAPGVAETGNREALAGLAALRAVLPAGAATLSPEAFEDLSAAVFDRGWITELV